MRRAVGAMSMVVALLLIALPGSAAADPPTTPNGWEGACNMNQSWPGLGRNGGRFAAEFYEQLAFDKRVR